MNTVELLMKLDKAEVETVEEKTQEIEVLRLSNLLKEKGIDEKFIITYKNISADDCYDARAKMFDTSIGQGDRIYEGCLYACACGIIDPKYDDIQLQQWLGLKMKQPIPTMVYGALLEKAEVVTIGNAILGMSETLNEHTVTRKAKKDKVKN